MKPLRHRKRNRLLGRKPRRKGFSSASPASGMEAGIKYRYPNASVVKGIVSTKGVTFSEGKDGLIVVVSAARGSTKAFFENEIKRADRIEESASDARSRLNLPPSVVENILNAP